MVCTRDGRRAFLGCNDGIIREWDLEHGKLLGQLKDHDSCVYDIALSHDEKFLVSGGRDKIVRIWNAETGELLKRCEGHEREVSEVRFSRDGKRVISAGNEGVRVWSMDTGALTHQMRKQRSYPGFPRWTWWVQSASISPDGRWVVFGGSDQAMILYDLERDQEHSEITGHEVKYEVAKKPAEYPSGRTQGCIVQNGIQFISNDVFLSVGADKTVRMWNRATGQELKKIDIQAAAWRFGVSSDGRRALMGCHDGTVRVLALPHLQKDLAVRDR